MSLGIRTDGDQDSWTNLLQNRVEMVDFEVKMRERQLVFGEREQKRKTEIREEDEQFLKGTNPACRIS